MNKIIYALLLTTCFLLPSCDKFLDIVPVGEVIPETLAEYRALMVSAYDKVPTDKNLAAFRTDEIDLSPADAQSMDSYRDIWTWNDANTSSQTTVFGWVQFYNAIYKANQVIENRNNMKEGTADGINQLVGEAYMMRAYMHFNLVNLYAKHYDATTAATDKGVPIKIAANPDEVLSRSSIAQVYAQVLADLVEAESLLNKESWEVGLNYRFNKISVEALRSRVYLYMGTGHWAESLKASENVLKVKNTLADLNTAKELPNYFTSVESIVAMEQNVTSSGIQAISVGKPLLNLYGTGDLRKTKYYKAITASIYSVLKGGNKGFKSSFRVGEIYLNAAEASYHLNDLNGAKKYLLTLLEKRYTVNRFPVIKAEIEAMTAGTFIAYLYDERFRELAFEGHRWFDLRRTTQPRLVKELRGQTYTLEQGDSRYTIKIPQDAIAGNPNLAN